MTAASQRATIDDIVPTPTTTKRVPTPEPNIAIDGAFAEFTRDSITIREIHKVSDLSADNPAVEALLTSGIPQPGSLHPIIWNLPLARNTAEMEKGCNSRAIVTSEYAYPTGSGMNYGIQANDSAEPDIEVSSAMSSIQTNLHYNHNGQLVPIVLSDEVIVEDPDTGTSTTRTVRISPIVETQVAMTTFIYRRKQNWVQESPGNPIHTKTVADLARAFVGTINMEPIFGDPLYTWLCTRIVGVRDLQHSNWVANVTYEFQYNPFRWLVPVSILDESGNPHPDATYVPYDEHAGNLPATVGRTEVRVLGRRNFHELELRF